VLIRHEESPIGMDVFVIGRQAHFTDTHTHTYTLVKSSLWLLRMFCVIPGDSFFGYLFAWMHFLVKEEMW